MGRAVLGALVAALALTVMPSTRAHAGTSAHMARAPVTIRLGEYFYRPSKVTVHVGQEVRFVNVGKIQHTNADTDTKWNIRSELIKPRPLSHGQIQTVRFTRPGLVHYLCTFHPTLMRGTIRVTP